MELRLFDRTVLITLGIVMAAFLLITWCICKDQNKSKKRTRRPRHAYPTENRRFTAANKYPDEIIYTTVKQCGPVVTNQNSVDGDAWSIASKDINAMSTNREFLSSPIAFLRKNGIGNEEIKKLMNHPNFLEDPLAAIKDSKRISKPESSFSPPEAARESSSSLSVVNEENEPPLFLNSKH